MAPEEPGPSACRELTPPGTPKALARAGSGVIDVAESPAKGADASTAGASRQPPNPDDLKNDFCEVCQTGGRLLLCDTCPRAFHARCIDRFVDLEGLEQCSDWKCPVCQHGPDILRGRAKPSATVREMQAQMAENLRRNKRQKLSAVRRRDLFLADRIDMIQCFASRNALRRLEGKEHAGGLPALDIGALVEAVGRDGQRYRGTVLLQSGERRYVVSEAETQAEVEFPRECLAPARQQQGDAAGRAADFLSMARRPVLTEGTTLKDYQAAGVNWLIHSIQNRCGGILADDMGLGKTVQTLATLSYLQTSGAMSGPFLVVCPLSCAGNWVREAKRFVPHMSVTKVCGSGKEREYCFQDDEVWFGMKDIIITTYETLVSTDEFFERQVWSTIVLDEAQRIKSEGSRIREALDGIDSAGRVLLTGTPLQNNMGELLALLRWLWPDVLAKESEAFTNAFQLLPGEAQVSRADARGTSGATGSVLAEKAVVNAQLVDKVRCLLGLMMLRRKKEEVISLPPKVLRDIWLPMARSQVWWYRALLRCRRQVQALGLRALLKLVVRLRQLSGHPRCIVASLADREGLATYDMVDKKELEKLTSGSAMSDEFVAQSGKLMFLDMLLGQLHAQNMAFCEDWRKAFDSRRKSAPSADGGGGDGGKKQPGRPKKSSVKQWLQKTDGILFLDEMRPWVKPTESALASKPTQPATVAVTSGDSGGTLFAADPQQPGAVAAQEDVEDGSDVPRPHKVLIFSQFHACLDMLEDFCAWRGWRALRLDGSTSRVLRELDMRDFNTHDEDYFVYLIGTRAGGLGINLASANHVVLFDQDWNPHVDLQAIDRAHRIGQRRVVNIYRLVQEWGVEERLIHRQEQKLQMEKCVIQTTSKEAEAAVLETSERLNADEIIMLLRFGEQALQQFDGENLGNWTLQAILDKKHLPLPVPETATDGAMDGPPQGASEGEFVEDEGEGGSHLALQAGEDGEEEGAEAPQTEPGAPAPTKPARTKEESQSHEPVRRTASGRVVKATKMVYIPEVPVKKSTVKKDPIKHCKFCFACGEDTLSVAKGRKRARDIAEGVDAGETQEPGGMALDTFCSLCPKAYHAACLGPDMRPSSSRWVCPWHRCGQCRRSQSACGGMLIHCLQCPTALCYDCFPPNFRRVHPPEKFWTDMNNRGYKVTPQKMVFFKCNACRALEEQRRRLQMRVEDLEAEQDEQKRQALEEKRTLETKKKREDLLERKRFFRQVMLQGERDRLGGEVQKAREELLSTAERLWPPMFRRRWLSCLQSAKDVDELAKAAGRKCKPDAGKSCHMASWMEQLQLAIQVCANCGFPGHEPLVCPKPQERVPHASDSAEKEGSGKKYKVYKKVCGLCRTSGHARVQCPELSPEQRAEYEARRADLGKLADAFSSVESPEEPQAFLEAAPVGADKKRLLEAWKEAKQQANLIASDALRLCGMDHLILDVPGGPEQAEGAAKAKGKAAGASSKSKAKGKLAGRVKALAKGKAKGASPKNASPKGKAGGAGRGRSLRGRGRGTGALKKAMAKKKPNLGPPMSAAQGRFQKTTKSFDDEAKKIKAAEGKQGRGADSGNGAKAKGCKLDGRIEGGVAGGWRVRVALREDGNGITVSYREPGKVPWMRPALTWMRLSSAPGGEDIRAALEKEGVELQEAFHDRARIMTEKAPRKTRKPEPEPEQAVTARPLLEARQIIEGPAAEWVVRGKTNPKGVIIFTFRRPGGSRWTNKGDAFAGVNKEVLDAVEVERQAIAANITKAKMAAFAERRADGDPPQPAPKRSRLQAQMGSQARPAPPRPAEAPGAQQQGSQSEVVRVTQGAAEGWLVRCAVSRFGPAVWDVQRPHGSRWEKLSVLRKAGLNKDVVAALEYEQQAFADHIARMVKAAFQGSAESADAEPADSARPMLIECGEEQSPLHMGSPRDVMDSPAVGRDCSPEWMVGGKSQPPEIVPEPPQLVESTSMYGRRRSFKATFLRARQRCVAEQSQASSNRAAPDMRSDH